MERENLEKLEMPTEEQVVESEEFVENSLLSFLNEKGRNEMRIRRVIIEMLERNEYRDILVDFLVCAMAVVSTNANLYLQERKLGLNN